ncbi:protein kinase (plasmid) [Rhodococcus sp. USK10]|uniref:protein kinase domain-containing protein n=1 Tax=Rhodococcus sp. USK10 TaxID=2789739 RepID=UPI001C5E9E81|nr:protein kinase [Rhodococcus sp. USK10]QYA99768.1 protein kinase [Rhodococcus sp. USK10]
MDADDPLRTQRDGAVNIASDLRSAGFGDASEIGRGGFGVVYRCVQTVLHRTVAVKVLTADVGDPNWRRFLREEQVMGQLTGHPNIVSALQVGVTEGGRPFIVMPYHEQGSLDDRIRRHGPLPLEEVLRLGVRLAGALETAHRLGIVHRDVKPANILRTDYGEPALTDFGIARIAGAFESATGVITGSPAFIAPEVLSGQAPSPAADIYGLGATLFCAYTGHAVFERRSGEQVLAQFLRLATEPAPGLREQGLPDDVTAAIERAMARAPQDRQASAAALGEELRDAEQRHGYPASEMALHDPADTKPPGRTPTPPENRPRTASRIRGDSPLELTSFIGRRSELSEAKNLLGSSRLVTLTGIGGVGKTRLALKVAASAQRGFADGAWLVELDETVDYSLVIEKVAAIFGLRDQAARRTEDVLVEFLSSREVLLLLDNCEQAVGAVAGLSATLLRACPRIRILATSREALGVGGEAVLRVPPLTVPDPNPPAIRGLSRVDAVALFVERAATMVPTFTLNEDNYTAVARICHRLDGLPLPIELAAARLRVLSPEQILQRLSDRFALLTRGSRSAPSRQQTLRLCIDWSYDLCNAAEQLVWSRLSVFVESVDLEAAEQVCGEGLTSEELLDLVTALVDKSILVREEHGTAVRFRLLETLRDYGREQAQHAGEYQDLRRRHRDWYMRLALSGEAEWISSRQLEWIAKFDREQANLREAMEFCVSDNPETGLTMAAALYPFWLARGSVGEGRRWLDRLLSVDAVTPTLGRVKGLFADSVLAVVQGDLERGADLVAEGHRLGPHLQDPLAQDLINLAAGILALFSNDLLQACPILEDAVEAFRTRDTPALQIDALDGLGVAYELRGDPAQALKCYEQVRAITESCGEVVYRSQALCSMAVAVWMQGDSLGATSLLGQSLKLSQLLSDRMTAAACLELLAWITANDDVRRAAVLMGAADELARSVGCVSVMFPNRAVHHEDCIRAVRHVLGLQGFEDGLRKGRFLDLDAAIAYALGTTSTPQPLADAPTNLTKRERQVAELVAEGLTNRKIADRLVISPRTAQGHVEHVLTKLGFTSRAQIAAWVTEQTHR